MSAIPLPRINHFLSSRCHSKAWNDRWIEVVTRIARAAEDYMKIYLLMLLIGALLTAIHLTAVPERHSETLPH
jgi:hypothetical protein